ncbi:hypothetical protein D3C73_1057990 [compost metagenome]
MDQGGKAHLLKHVEIVIARRAIGAKRYRDSCTQQLRNPGYSARQLQITARVMGYPYMVTGQNLNLFIVQMNTMSDKGRAGEHSQLLQMRYRTQTVISRILLDFPPGFRHVGMHRQVQIMGGLNKLHEKLRRTGVRGMR